MAAPLIVQSVPWMPERAWTTCVAEGCISGLARSNYVPFAPQPLPPGMTEAEYEALDPGTPPAPDDCFPRYVMWREDRNPDFSGGEPRIDWTRNPGWDFRNDCVATFEPATVVSGKISFIADGQAVCPGTTVHLINETTPADVTTVTDSGGNYLFTDPVGFAQDDQWHIRIVAGAVPCNNGDTPVNSGSQAWNEGTGMIQDLDIPGI